MAEWRRLEADDVRAILQSFGRDDYRRHVTIRAGTINTNIRVDTASGPLFLRVNEGKSLDDVNREAAIVSHVAGRGVPTPTPRPGLDGQPFVLWRDQIVSLFEWVHGDILLREQLMPVHATEVGGALANLHLAGADFCDRRTGRYEPEEIGRRLERIAALERADLSQAVAVLVPELALLQRERAPTLPTGLIHGDLFVDNVLFEDPTLDDTEGIDAKAAARALADDSALHLRALLDFEQASWGRLAYDLAVTVLAFGFGRDDFRPDLVRALLDAYVALRPPTAAERAAFPAELRFAACRFAITRITDVHLKRGTGAAPGKRYERYLDRLFRLKDHLVSGDGLLSL